MSTGCLCSQLHSTHLDPCGGSCRREKDELTCQGIVWDKKQWNNQNYRERLFGEWAACGFLGLKKGRGIQEKKHFKCLLLKPVTNSPSVWSFSVLLDDEKTKLVTQHLYSPSSMCAVTRSQHLHFQLQRWEKKTTSEECYYQRYLTGSRRLRRRWRITLLAGDDL